METRVDKKSPKNPNVSLFLREAISLAHMLMERVIHFLSTKRTWQAQFEWLHDGHMPSVILVSCARGSFRRSCGNHP